MIDDSTLGEYQLVRPLGRGGMGQVFLGHDRVLDRAVAIKLLASAAPDAAARDRFLIEARAIARLAHPNVVAVYRAGETADGRPYLVQEFVRGQSMDRLRPPLPAAEVRRIGVDIARGLAAAHRRGVLHRDLKPANVMMADDGTVKILDFGLAKLRPLETAPSPEVAARRAIDSADDSPTTVAGKLGPGVALAETLDPGPAASDRAGTNGLSNASPPESDLGLTEPGALLGTPRYMAPEQWRGETATEQTDVYALGAILFELAAGRPVHATRELDELRASVVDQDAPRLADHAPDIDPALAAVVDRALARRPEERPASAELMAQALSIAGVATPVKRTGNPYRGLATFTADDHALFFGRSADVGAIVDRLRSEQALIVAGDSGVGKSSLIRAGVLPAIANGGLGGDRTWRTMTLRPGTDPLAALGAALAMPERDDASLAAAITGATRTGHGVAVFIDQAEELITQSSPEAAARFADVLTEALARAPGLRVIAAVRGDFVTRFAEVPGLAGLVTRGLHLVSPLDERGRREAIVGPAEAAGVELEPAAVDALVAESGGRGGLPLLQFALALLWQRHDPQARTITAAEVAALGGVGGALARHADGVLAALDPASRGAARRLIVSMVTADNTTAVRDEADLALDTEGARAALDALVDGRLVVARDGARGASYALAHDALIVHWDTLTEWLADDVGLRARRQRITAASVEWERLGRGRDGLLAPRQLAEAASLDELPERERALISASRRAIARRRRIAVGLAVLAGTALLAAWLVPRWLQRREREQAIAVHVTNADARLAAAHASTSDVARLRSAALAEFRGPPTTWLSASWTEALAATRTARQKFVDVAADLEAALMIEVRDDLRTRLASVLLEHATLADTMYDRDGADQLARRAAGLDPELAAAWSAPAHLAISVTPPARIEVTCAGKRVLEQVGASATVTHAPASCSITAALDGRVRVVMPVLLVRGASQTLELALPPLAERPADFVYIPRGQAILGSSDHEDIRLAQGAVPAFPVELPAYWIAPREVTVAEWLAWVDTLPAAEQDARRPHSIDDFSGGVDVSRDASDAWTYTFHRGDVTYRARAGEPLRYQGRTTRAVQRWERFPVAAISYDDAVRFAGWLRSTKKIPGARLCTSAEWERAARGADGRRYPHGSAPPNGTDFNHDVTYGQQTVAFGPDEVGSYPASDSPFGISDLAGNVWELVDGHETLAIVRGGSWYANAFAAQSPNAWLAERTTRDAMTGLRLCADAR